MEPLNHQHRSRAQAEADFVPQLKRGSQLSLEKQFVQAVREAIGSGRLRPGMRLPSSRRFAAELQVNRNTVVHALYQLVADGYLTGQPGSGTFVSETIPRAAAPSSRTSPSPLHRELPPLPELAIPARFGGVLAGGICQPSTATFPLVHWRKAWQQATRHVPSPQ